MLLYSFKSSYGALDPEQLLKPSLCRQWTPGGALGI